MRVTRTFSLVAVTMLVGILAACGGAETTDAAATPDAGDGSTSPPATASSGGSSGNPGYGGCAKGGPTACTVGVTVYGKDECLERFTTCTFLSNVCPYSDGIYCGTGPKTVADASSDADASAASDASGD